MNVVKRQKRTSAIKKIRAKFGYGCKYEVLIFCSNRNIYAQVIDLLNGKTLFTTSTLKLAKSDNKNAKNINYGKELGIALAKLCKDRNINPSFNRANKIFHGVVKSVADSFYSNLN